MRVVVLGFLISLWSLASVASDDLTDAQYQALLQDLGRFEYKGTYQLPWLESACAIVKGREVEGLKAAEAEGSYIIPLVPCYGQHGIDIRYGTGAPEGTATER